MRRALLSRPMAMASQDRVIQVIAEIHIRRFGEFLSKIEI